MQSPPFPVTSSLLGPNIHLNTMFSNTLSFLSSRNVNDQVSHPYKTGKIIVPYILIFKFFDSNLEDKRCMKIINTIKKQGDYFFKKNGFLAIGQYFRLSLKVRKITPYVEVMFPKFSILDIP